MKTRASETRTFVAMREMLTKSLPKGGEAWLYGSRARGDARKNSDWDVLVLLDKEKITIEDDRDFTMHLKLLGYDYGQEINTQIFTMKEWEAYAGTPFNQNVIHDRIRIS